MGSSGQTPEPGPRRIATFIGPAGLAELRGGPTRVQMSSAAADAGTGRRLWELSEQLTDVQFVFPTPVQ